MTPLGLDNHGYPVFISSTTKNDTEILDMTTPDDLELARRRDAVRDAAREFEVLSDQDITERLLGKTNRKLDSSEIASFRVDVREQVLDDLLDILDNSTRGKLRSRRLVRVVAPKGYRRKTINSLSPDERDQIKERLIVRGWTEIEIGHVIGLSRSEVPAP